ncbi:MAG: metallophosphoesterase family protein [Gammaproteobacteria bacterium]
MADSLTWLHLSDFHLCEPVNGWDATQIVTCLKDDIGRILREQDLRPDLLFVTGDLAWGQLGDGDKSLASQFLETHGVIEEVRELLGLEKKRVFLVPGNHDIDRDKVLEPQTKHLQGLNDEEVNSLMQTGGSEWQAYAQRLYAYRDFIAKYYSHLYQDPERLIYANTLDINGLKVGIAGLNSAWSATGKPGDKGKLRLGKWQLMKLSNQLDKDKAQFKIAVAHHPFNWLTSDEDPSLNRILERYYNVFLHGHEHSAWVQQPQGGLLRVAAGACYGKTPQESGYNFVRIRGSQVEVWLRRFDENGQGWVPCPVYQRTDNNDCWSLTLSLDPFAEIKQHGPTSVKAEIKGRGPDSGPAVPVNHRQFF